MEGLIEKLFNKNLCNKKSIENAVIILIICIIVIIVINCFQTKENNDAHLTNSYMMINETNEKCMEEKLSEILSKIDGAGDVDVMISYVNEVEKIPMTDKKITTTIVNEKDSNGGERKTEETSTEESIIFEEKTSVKSPVIKQSILPEIVGVIIVADGAKSLIVKENLIKAVEATVNVPSHRIQVFPRS